MTDPINAALEAGAQAACRWPDGLSCHSSAPEPACDFCRGQAASIVSATLRALHPHHAAQGIMGPDLAEIAAAVEAAALRAMAEGAGE